MTDEPDEPKLHTDKPLYLMQGSPLVAGGKARLMSNRKVPPNRAKPREVSGPEMIGYTTEAQKGLRGEGEVPSGAWLDASCDRAFMLNQQARLADIAQAMATRPQLTIEHRMADARRRARMQHIDLRSEFTALERMLDHAKTESETRRARTEAAAVRRLEGVELRLDQPPSDLAA